VVEEKNRLIRNYKNTAKYTKDLRALRDDIQDQRDEANTNLNELLLDDFKQLGVQYEQATWDSFKDTDGRPIKRALTINDIASLHPFHWGYEFDQVMNERGGFDIIITNPPWEILKPQAKEFFETHSKLVSKNKMRIEDFESEKANLLQDAEIRSAWLEYQSVFPFQSAYFRKTQQYKTRYRPSMVRSKELISIFTSSSPSNVTTSYAKAVSAVSSFPVVSTLILEPNNFVRCSLTRRR